MKPTIGIMQPYISFLTAKIRLQGLCHTALRPMNNKSILVISEFHFDSICSLIVQGVAITQVKEQGN